MDVGTGAIRADLGVNGDPLFSPDGRWLAIREARQVRLFNVGAYGEVAILRGHTRDLLGIAFSPSGDVIASWAGDGTIRTYELSGARILQDACGRLRFQPDWAQVAGTCRPFSH